MNSLTKTLLQLALLSALTVSLAACGQKGPLEVEQPNPIQEEEKEPTK